jgi:uncharacterized protein YukE
MSAYVTEYVQPIAQPLDSLQGQFTQLAAIHRDANARLHSQTDELVSSGTSDTFQGEGAKAYSDLVNYYLTTSEKHLQVLEDAAHNIKTNHATIMDATSSAASANLHEGLTNKVLTQVTHDQIIQQGGAPIWSVVNELLSTLKNMEQTAGSFFGDIIHGHVGAALGALGHEFSDVGQLAGDITSLLQDIGNVLGQWADDVSNAVNRCLQFLGHAVVGLLDFFTGFSSMVNDVKTIFSGKASLLDKLLAAGDLVLNAGMDVLMLTGIGEELRLGELAVKGIVEVAKGFGREAAEQGVKDVAEQGSKDIVEQGGKDAIEQGAKNDHPGASDAGSGDGGGGGGQRPYAGSNGENPDDLIRQLRESGKKFNEKDIVGITRTPSGEINWLEEGNPKSGLEHIMNGDGTPGDEGHGQDFANIGVQGKENVARLIIDTVQNETPVKTMGASGRVYNVTVNGVLRRILIVVGSNGYIVTAYPIGG